MAFGVVRVSGWWSSRGDLKWSAQQCFHLLSWCALLKGFSGASVELGCDLVGFGLAALGEVEFSRQVLT
jgi:hypothetical protein